ncbi:hypothetical protein RFF05_03865 [Bengtsoniella intestinalis]|uniref:hypothetical protein n=1 Tax=Bengtsoniella intestinalis TaxID=3073143 RepID=UPI00391F4468
MNCIKKVEIKISYTENLQQEPTEVVAYEEQMIYARTLFDLRLKMQEQTKSDNEISTIQKVVRE